MSNLMPLKLAATHLAHLREKVLFVGGAVLPVLIQDPAASEPRKTKDVDCVVEITSYSQYARLSKELGTLGFKQPPEKTDILCRFFLDELILDVLPTDPSVLGFSNRFYFSAVRFAQDYILEDNLSIKHIDAPHFIATKIEAFKDRGHNDYLASHDMEDIIAILDGRPAVEQEIAETEQLIREHIVDNLNQFINNDNFLQALQGFFPSSISAKRADIILSKIGKICNG